MMNNYKKLFEKISPKESDEMLISKVLTRKAENMKHNEKSTKKLLLKKAVVIPAAAALALGTATLTVGAVNNWDYEKAFKGMFAEQYEGNVPVSEQIVDKTIEGSSAGQSSALANQHVEHVPERPIGTFDFEKYGKELGIVMQGDGITATVDGILAYDDMCYIMYTTTATDELLEKTGGKVPGLRIDFGNFGFKIDGKRAAGMGYTAEPISKEGNTQTGIMKVHYDSVDLSGKTLNITFLAETEDDTVLLKEEKDILIDFPIAENVEKELDLKLKTDSFDGKITKVKVGGFSTTIDYEGVSNVPPIDSGLLEAAYNYESKPGQDWTTVTRNPEIDLPKNSRETLYDELKAFGDAVLTLKDGTTVEAKFNGLGTHGEDGNMTGCVNFEYTYPLNPSDVVSIKFGDITINL